MQTGIMGEPSHATIDVRDMLCAQALAVVAEAMAKLPIGAAAAIHYNTDDVKRDLCVWANERQYGVSELDEWTLRFERRHES